MSSFKSRRKARVINVDEDEAEGVENADTSAGDTPVQEHSPPSFKINSAKKGLRQSGLRKTFTAEALDGQDPSAPVGDEEDNDGPVVVKPKLGAQNKNKKKIATKKPASRLSLGLADNDDEGNDGSVPSLPMKTSTLGQRAMGNSAARRGIAMRGMPTRTFENDSDRPRYSKEYLDELQSSTPTTPMALEAADDDADEMQLDASELDGAVVVVAADDSSDTLRPPAASTTRIRVLTEAEIQERKERRVRLAQEQDFLSVEDDGNEDDADDDDDDDSSSRRKKKKKKNDGTRLATDEDQLGEGFDDFVDDGGVSLGRRAERQRRRRERQRMAELIREAEGHSSDESSDSEADRRIAYEASQTRAGLEGGLTEQKPSSSSSSSSRHHRRDDGGNNPSPSQHVPPPPSKISPLPTLAGCVARLRASLDGVETRLRCANAEVARLRAEKEDVAARETQLQALLDEAGRKYRLAVGGTASGGAGGDISGGGNSAVDATANDENKSDNDN